MRIKMNQEPLGVASDVVLPQQLTRWSNTLATNFPTDYSSSGEQPAHQKPPFVLDHQINQKIILWSVLLCKLHAESLKITRFEFFQER